MNIWRSRGWLRLWAALCITWVAYAISQTPRLPSLNGGRHWRAYAAEQWIEAGTFMIAPIVGGTLLLLALAWVAAGFKQDQEPIAANTTESDKLDALSQSIEALDVDKIDETKSYSLMRFFWLFVTSLGMAFFSSTYDPQTSTIAGAVILRAIYSLPLAVIATLIIAWIGKGSNLIVNMGGLAATIGIVGYIGQSQALIASGLETQEARQSAFFTVPGVLLLVGITCVVAAGTLKKAKSPR